LNSFRNFFSAYTHYLAKVVYSDPGHYSLFA